MQPWAGRGSIPYTVVSTAQRGNSRPRRAYPLLPPKGGEVDNVVYVGVDSVGGVGAAGEPKKQMEGWTVSLA
jgi:hypothetical protein